MASPVSCRVATLLILAGCSRSVERSGDAATTAPIDASAPTLATATTKSTQRPALGEACDGMFSCDQPPGCSVSCASQYDRGTRISQYCQLRTVTSKEGAEPCVGEAFRGEKSSTDGASRILRAFLCDQEAGLYCDPEAHRCRKTAALGQKCSQDDECGRSARCRNQVCAAAMPVGASCKEVRCVSTAYCTDKKTCAQRKALGQACTFGTSECVTDYCVNGTCGRRDPEPKCEL